MLSAYELQRQRNIERNNGVLEALGLRDAKLKPEPPPKAKPRLAEDIRPAVATRHSERASKKPALYAGLTDEFFKWEDMDDDDEGRSTRKVQRPRRTTQQVKTFMQEYDYVVRERPRKHGVNAVVSSMMPSSAGRLDASNTCGNMPVHYCHPGGGQVFGRSMKFRCPRCHSYQALRADGVTLQKHGNCGSVCIF